MATFDFSVLGSPEQAYNLAQKRVQVFKDAGQHIGDAVNKGIDALTDENVKNKVISAITSKWTGLQGREEDMRKMDSKTLAGQVFVMNTIDKYIQTKKAEHPDEGAAFSGPETFFGTDPSHLEQILKAIDGQAATAKASYEDKKTGKQIAGFDPNAPREQDVATGIAATPGEGLTEEARKTFQLASSRGDLMGTQQRGATASGNLELSREQLIRQLEIEKNDELARKTATKFKLSEKEKDWNKWKKAVTEGVLPYDEAKDKQMQDEIIALKLEDENAKQRMKEYENKMKGMREKWNQTIPTPKESGKTTTPTVNTSTGGKWTIKAK